MGSDSDWSVMEEAAKVLDEFGVGYEVDVVSAHRTPHRMIDYGTGAHARGLRVLIAESGFRLPDNVPTLGTILHDAGWSTAAVHSAFPVSAFFGFQRGFGKRW